MIEINLLPGAGKKNKRGGGGSSFDVGAAFRGFAAKAGGSAVSSAATPTAARFNAFRTPASRR